MNHVSWKPDELVLELSTTMLKPSQENQIKLIKEESQELLERLMKKESKPE